MIKTTILAVIALATFASESQARPQIWNFLGGVAVGSALAYTYDYGYAPGSVHYYVEPQRYRQCDPYVTHYARSRYYYREPQVVYYGRPVYGRCR